MLRENKQAFVEQMGQDLDAAQGVLFLDYTKLTVEEADRFRRKLDTANLAYRVVKNTLMARVLEGRPYQDAAECLKGSPTGVLIGREDPVEPAKILFEFIKECSHLRVKGGVVDNKAIVPEQAEALSKMPSRPEMQAQVVALALSPGSKLISQIKNPAGRIVGAVEKLAEQEAQ